MSSTSQSHIMGGAAAQAGQFRRNISTLAAADADEAHDEEEAEAVPNVAGGQNSLLSASNSTRSRRCHAETKKLLVTTN